MNADTKCKIEAHIRKHRKSGGPAKGRDDAEEDLKSKPADRTADNKVGPEAEETKAKNGGRIKRKEGGPVHGMEVMHHAGRKPRASGGTCEANPFTTARNGTAPAGRKTMKVSQGLNH